MRAIKYTKYGSPRDVHRPVENASPPLWPIDDAAHQDLPSDVVQCYKDYPESNTSLLKSNKKNSLQSKAFKDRVLVRIAAVGINPGDGHLSHGTPVFIRLMQEGLRAPGKHHQTLGMDFAGVVVAVGSNVSHVKAGDYVFGDCEGAGCLAEFASVKSSEVAIAPPISPVHAAAMPDAAMVAYQGLMDHGRLEKDDTVLIIGSGGGIGTFAVQLARALGASHITAVCSTRHVALSKELGADLVVDYKDPKASLELLSRKWDIILDMVCDRPLGKLNKLLARGGRYVSVAGGVGRILWTSIYGMFHCASSKSFGPMLIRPRVADMDALAQLVRSQQLHPVMDRVFAFDQSADAIQYVSEKRSTGKVVVIVNQDMCAEASTTSSSASESTSAVPSSSTSS